MITCPNLLLVRPALTILAVVASVVASCAHAVENGERSRSADLGAAGNRDLTRELAPATSAASEDAAAMDAAPRPRDSNVVLGGAAVSEEVSDGSELAKGPGACPDWLPSSHVAFNIFRSSDTPSFPRGGDATCCSMTTTDLLCRTHVSAEHVVGAMYGSSVVGVRRGMSRPSLDVPLEVRQHGNMKSPGPILVRLKVTTTDRLVTLALSDGACPRPCLRISPDRDHPFRRMVTTCFAASCPSISPS